MSADQLCALHHSIRSDNYFHLYRARQIGAPGDLGINRSHLLDHLAAVVGQKHCRLQQEDPANKYECEFTDRGVHDSVYCPACQRFAIDYRSNPSTEVIPSEPPPLRRVEGSAFPVTLCLLLLQIAH